jgi:NAD(P)-dependent dehydrogenase (short-subunit alcohol dehydrogenase family)
MGRSVAGRGGLDLAGRTVVITGASSGIGAAAARALAARGATVVPVGRSARRTAEIAGSIGAEPMVADFADLTQVRRLAGTVLDRCPRIDVLINNAGSVIPDRRITGDGYETMFQVNYLAPFLLTTLLLPRLRHSARRAPVRIVSTSSLGSRLVRMRLDDLQWERRPWLGGWFAYGATKRMIVLFTRELARREGAGITAVSVHPGLVDTRFAAEHRVAALLGPVRRMLISADRGAQPLIWLATSPVDADGAYFERFRRTRHPRGRAGAPALGAALWRHTEALLGVDPR